MQQELYKTIPEFPNYAISTYGNVINKKTGLVLKAFLNSRGYLRVTLCRPGYRRHMFIHILVAQAFVPNPLNKGEVNHKNGYKDDCRVENLEWVTHSENIIHAFAVGLNPGRYNARPH